MWEMARKQPQDMAALQRIPDIPHRTLQQDGETLLQLIRQTLHLNAEAWPARLDPPLAQKEGPLLKCLKNHVREQAEQLNLPPEILLRKKEYEAIIRSGMKGGTYVLPARLLGWRHGVIGESLLRLAQEPIVPTSEPNHESDQ